jgi:hypothetical protein
MKRSQWASTALLLLREKDRRCLAVSRRPSEQILNLIEREPPVDKANWLAGWHSVLVIWL